MKGFTLDVEYSNSDRRWTVLLTRGFANLSIANASTKAEAVQMARLELNGLAKQIDVIVKDTPMPGWSGQPEPGQTYAVGHQHEAIDGTFPHVQQERSASGGPVMEGGGSRPDPDEVPGTISECNDPNPIDAKVRCSLLRGHSGPHREWNARGANAWSRMPFDAFMLSPFPAGAEEMTGIAPELVGPQHTPVIPPMKSAFMEGIDEAIRKAAQPALREEEAAFVRDGRGSDRRCPMLYSTFGTATRCEKQIGHILPCGPMTKDDLMHARRVDADTCDPRTLRIAAQALRAGTLAGQIRRDYLESLHRRAAEHIRMASALHAEIDRELRKIRESEGR